MSKVRSMARLEDVIARAQSCKPIRIAIVSAAQKVVLTAVENAKSLGIVEPVLIGNRDDIRACANEVGFDLGGVETIGAADEVAAARAGVELVRKGQADGLMKGHIHTDTLMHPLLDRENGLRLPGQRVCHVFVVDIPTYPKLLAITDAAINISPDLTAKAQILENAFGLVRLLGVKTPKAAILSAVETINPAIASTLDAACLSLMAKRGQIAGAGIVDGPMAFDNAISADAAHEKNIVSEVSGDVDILLVPDLVSGNILAKNLEYLAGATAAGVVMGLSVPVVLSSRADPPESRLAALALAALMHARAPTQSPACNTRTREPAMQFAPQPKAACCPIGA